jgi:hypothetical protein
MEKVKLFIVGFSIIFIFVGGVIAINKGWI